MMLKKKEKDNSLVAPPDMTRAVARRGAALLVSTELADEVASLEPLEAYYIVREIGLDQALPILQEFNNKQLGVCVDLDCWSRHDFAADGLDEWLAAFALAGPESLASTFLALDYVVQLLFLADTVTVYDPDTDQVPPEENGPESLRAMTPDGFYLLELKTTKKLTVHPFTLLDAMYQYDPTAIHALLSQVRVDLQTQIEEEALRFRNGRMQDIGFVAPDEAAVLFSRPSPKPSLRFREPLDSISTRVPSVYAASLNETSLLYRALALISDPESLTRLEQELVWAINSAIIAYGEKTKDTRQITDIAERVRDTISLGLEVLLSQQQANCALDDVVAVAAKAADLLDIWCITDLFRHGFAAALSLQDEVRQALVKPKFSDWYSLAETEQSADPGDRMARAFVAALLARHPLHGGYELSKVDNVKAFTSLADINLARGRLQQLIALVCD